MRIQKYLIVALLGAMTFAACTKDEGVGIKTREDYQGKVENGIPTYPDYYIDVAGWDYRMSWNLANVHDPSIAYYDGYYYMFGTDASYGNEHDKASIGRHFQGKRSKDLVNWTHIYGPFNEAPTWVKDSLNSIRGRMNLAPIENPNYGYWAPVIRVVDGKLRMYYSIIIDNQIDGKNSWGERAFIGMCETTDPSNWLAWEDHGYVVSSSTDKSPEKFREGTDANGISSYGNAYFYYNAIDPTYIVDQDGKHWLIYGSWHSGFALMEIDPASGKPKAAYDDNGNFVGLGEPWNANPNYGTRIATRHKTYRWQGSEGPEIIYYGGYYYLFMAYDGLDVPYNTRVLRASSVEGPYYDITGNNNTENGGDTYPIVTHPYAFNGSHGWVGISHCAIFQQEGTGDWFYCSQGRLPGGVYENASSNAIMMGHVRRIVWVPSSAEELDDLWPLSLPERYAGLAKTTVKASEIAGTYEHINLKYQASVQQTPTLLTLASDGTMSGALSGTWTFDESKQYLTLAPTSGTKVVVAVYHEADWEASPRKETMVYAGTHKSLNATWWGKKVETTSTE